MTANYDCCPFIHPHVYMYNTYMHPTTHITYTHAHREGNIKIQTQTKRSRKRTRGQAQDKEEKEDDQPSDNTAKVCTI